MAINGETSRMMVRAASLSIFRMCRSKTVVSEGRMPDRIGGSMGCTNMAALCYGRPQQELCPLRISHRHGTLSMSSTRRWGPPMMIESLEARQFLSVTALYRNDGVLVVTGTRRADHIEVGPNADIAPGDTTVMANGRLIRD